LNTVINLRKKQLDGYKYKYFKFVFEYKSSTSTSTKYYISATNSFLLLVVVTSVPLLAQIDQEM